MMTAIMFAVYEWMFECIHKVIQQFANCMRFAHHSNNSKEKKKKKKKERKGGRKRDGGTKDCVYLST